MLPPEFFGSRKNFSPSAVAGLCRDQQGVCGFCLRPGRRLRFSTIRTQTPRAAGKKSGFRQHSEMRKLEAG